MTTTALNNAATSTPAPGFSIVQSAGNTATGDTQIGGLFGALLDALSAAIRSATGTDAEKAKGAAPALAESTATSPIPPGLGMGFNLDGHALASTALPSPDTAAGAQAVAGDPAMPAPGATPQDNTAPQGDAAPQGAPPSLLGDLAAALKALDKALAEGDKPDPKSLDRLDGALDALLGVFGQPAPAAPTTDGVTATPADSGIQSAPRFTVDPKPLLAELSGKLAGLAQKVTATAPDTAAKLNELAKDFGSGTISATTLQKLGFTIDTSTPQQQVTAAIADKLSNAPAKDGAQLFTPAKLDLPAGSPLTARPAQAQATSPAPTTATTQAASGTQPQGGGSGQSVTEAKRATPDKPTQGSAPTKAADAATPATPGNAPSTDAAAPGQAQAAAAQPARTDLPAHFKPVQAAYQAAQVQINMPAMAFQIAHHASQGDNHFQIRLDPPDLGRVDVKLHLDATGTINATMTVDRSETLDLMQRDRTHLERALAQAGLDAGKTNLEFSLRQNPFSQPQQGNGGGGNPGPTYRSAASGSEATEPAPVAPATLYRLGVSPTGVNIFA